MQFSAVSLPLNGPVPLQNEACVFNSHLAGSSAVQLRVPNFSVSAPLLYASTPSRAQHPGATESYAGALYWASTSRSPKRSKFCVHRYDYWVEGREKEPASCRRYLRSFCPAERARFSSSFKLRTRAKAHTVALNNHNLTNNLPYFTIPCHRPPLARSRSRQARQ